MASVGIHAGYQRYVFCVLHINEKPICQNDDQEVSVLMGNSRPTIPLRYPWQRAILRAEATNTAIHPMAPKKEPA